jgi:hypothetical protein
MSLAEATILDACENPALFGRWFRDASTWRAWFVFLRALFGLPMAEQDRALFEQCTGRAEPPAGGVREAWLILRAPGGQEHHPGAHCGVPGVLP